LARAEVVDVEIAPSLARKQQRRAVAILDPVERVERASLEWDRSQARLCFRDLELAASEGTAHVDDPFLAVNVALLEGDPLRRPDPCSGREQDHRPVPRPDRRPECFQFGPGLERLLPLPPSHWAV